MQVQSNLFDPKITAPKYHISFTPDRLQGHSRPFQVLVSAKLWKSKDSVQLGSREEVKCGYWLLGIPT